MRRLTLRRPALRRRLADERGAVAITVALLMVPLLGLGAITVDVAALHAERQELRNAADAAALAVAVDCAHERCGATVATADSLVRRNARSMSATLTPTAVRIDPGTSSVSVTTGADQKHWFAPALGHDSSRVSATSTAAWTGLSSSSVEVPIALARCQFEQLRRGVPVSLSPAENRTCAQGGQQVPAVIWLTTNPTSPRKKSDPTDRCWTTTSVGAVLSTFPPTPDAMLPDGCDTSTVPLRQRIGQTVVVPVFDSSGGSSVVYGFVAVAVADFLVRKDVQVVVELTTSVTLSDAPVHRSAPDLGARTVYLTEQR